MKIFASALIFIWGLILVAATSEAAHAERRVALVIGNAQYKNPNNSLANPLNDARDVAALLTSLGFEVVLTVDADKRQFDGSLQQFARMATDADAALFYYAGHAMQYAGHNYLMPTDAELEDEVSLPYQMVDLESVRFAIERAKGAKILILDACRTNPVADRFVRAVAGPTRTLANVRGLARIDKTEGMVVSYATAADQVAEDGKSRNSTYTTALLTHMKEAGLEIEMMFRRVAQDVTAQTRGRQRPETVVSLLGEFYLNRSDATAWEQIKDAQEPGAFRGFMSQFPFSPRVQDAKYRLEMIELTARTRAQAEEQRRAAERQAEEQRKAAERQADEQRKAAEREADARREADRKFAERIAALDAASKALPPPPPPPPTPKADELTWDFLKDSSDIAALKRFVAEFPHSALRAKAEARIAALAAVPPPPPPPPPGPSVEDLMWALVKDTKDPDQLRRFIAQFPNSPRRADAEQRVAALAAEAAKGPVPPPAPQLDRRDIARWVQLELKRVGCFTGPVDGEYGATTRTALQNFAKLAPAKLADTDPTPATVKAIQDFNKRVCPLECPSGERADGDRCIRIVCPAGEVMRNGACVAKVATEQKRTVTPEAKPPHRVGGGGGKCFQFQGRQFCE